LIDERKRSYWCGEQRQNVLGRKLEGKEEREKRRVFCTERVLCVITNLPIVVARDLIC
jgi:hypothetical protein